MDTSTSSNENLLEIIIGSQKEKLNNVLQKYSFCLIDKNYNINGNQLMIDNIKESEFIIINQCKEKKQDVEYFIICFKNSMVFIEKSLISILKPFFDYNRSSTVCFLYDTKESFSHRIKIENKQIESETVLHLKEEIQNFNSNIDIYQQSSLIICKKRKSIVSCISCYMILKGYSKLKRLKSNQKSFRIFDENDFITLRNIGEGHFVELIYEIESEELYAYKKINIDNYYLFERELQNYLNIDYPFLPKLYGKGNTKCSLIIQFINGCTLTNIKQFHFTNKEKIVLIFVLLMTINYLHEHEFIYRDLKPDNVMIDDQNRFFIIDFDRMKKYDSCDFTNDLRTFTNDFQSVYVAPEVNLGEIKYANDIYSIGQMIYYIINEKAPNVNNQQNAKIEFFNDDSSLLSIYVNCTNDSADKRPNISELLFEFYLLFSYEINNSFISSFPEVQYFNGIIDQKEEYINQNVDKYKKLMNFAANQNSKNSLHYKCIFNLGSLYYTGNYGQKDIKKAIELWKISADNNHLSSQSNLGEIYLNGIDTPKDINKSIHYYQLAANQNDKISQFNLGIIYFTGKFITPDITKAIYYLSLSSDQNYAKSQNVLGQIYYYGKYVKRDINKAIHYLTLAANQKDFASQSLLSLIYSEGKYIPQDLDKAVIYASNNKQSLFLLGNAYCQKGDINKSIKYFLLAANQNQIDAQISLGRIYYEGKYITQDINKAIHYFTQAANQNSAESQYNLGIIYYKGEYVVRDINKAIDYLTLSANQNHVKALFNLGQIYLEGKYIACDLDKAVKYYTMAADLNELCSQFFLGLYYSENIYIKCDINKAIKYFSLAANNNNHCFSQNRLGLIYYENKYIQRDINKSIFYFTKAASQNNKESQFYLGKIYSDAIYITQNINKAIYYYSCAANQNVPEAQNNLGLIYFKGEYVKRDLEKALFYYQQAANQNLVEAQLNLGIYYYSGKYVKYDIEKAIYYFNLAANQNNNIAQFYLGIIYSNCKYIKKDIDKAIHYYSLAADQNLLEAFIKLGFIYIFEKEDIKKAIHYFSHAADNNLPIAQLSLGIIYYDERYHFCNINKSIKYLTLAANQKKAIAQMILGFIYYENKFIKQDMKKSIYYFTLSANQNEPVSQYFLGFFYYYGFHCEQNYNKALDFFIQSSSNGFSFSSSIVGFFYHEGKYVEKNINKAIHYYYKASNLNNNFAKNNLGIIYKHGDDDIQQQLILATEFFKEGINKMNDKICMYNLAHLYIYEIGSKEKIDESINLLIKSSNLHFQPSIDLLCISLILKNGYNFNEIEKDIINKANGKYELKENVFQLFEKNCLTDEILFNDFFQSYKTIDFLYDTINFYPIPSKYFNKDKPMKKESQQSQNDITQDFYDGFGHDL